MANPTGKGGFKERPQDINLAGAPKRGQSWAERIDKLTDMTREELIEYVGKNTKIGKLLKELSPKIPVKDALILISIIQYGRDPNPRLLSTLMDREDGKPTQPISGGGEPLEVIFRYATSGNPATPASSETDPDKDGTTP